VGERRKEFSGLEKIDQAASAQMSIFEPRVKGYKSDDWVNPGNSEGYGNSSYQRPNKFHGKTQKKGKDLAQD